MGGGGAGWGGRGGGGTAGGGAAAAAAGVVAATGGGWVVAAVAAVAAAVVVGERLALVSKKLYSGAHHIKLTKAFTNAANNDSCVGSGSGCVWNCPGLQGSMESSRRVLQD